MMKPRLLSDCVGGTPLATGLLLAFATLVSYPGYPISPVRELISVEAHTHGIGADFIFDLLVKHGASSGLKCPRSLPTREVFCSAPGGYIVISAVLATYSDYEKVDIAGLYGSPRDNAIAASVIANVLAAARRNYVIDPERIGCFRDCDREERAATPML